MKKETAIGIIIGLMVVILMMLVAIAILTNRNNIFSQCEGLSDLTNITYKGVVYNCGDLRTVNTTIAMR